VELADVSGTDQRLTTTRRSRAMADADVSPRSSSPQRDNPQPDAELLAAYDRWLAAWRAYEADPDESDRLRSLQAVDDLVGSVVDALRRTGQLERTYLVYTSDNGFHLGQHRLGGGKTTAYEEDIRVPLVIRGPGVPQGRRVAAMVLNNDLAPTLAAMAGVEPPAFVDGRSFLPLLADPRLGWRRSFLVERRETERRELRGPAVFDALRVPDLVYVEHGTGERELYDLRRDPLQLDNRAGTTAPPLLAALSLRLAELKNCAAATCRDLEDRPLGPIPAGGPK
jgi:arylsulfatase A-like enzyme